MKIVWYIFLLIGLAVGMAWLSIRDAKEERNMLAIQRQRLIEEQEKAKEKEENERLRKEKERELADKAVKMLQAYIGREEIRLKKIIEEAKINVERVDLDMKDLSDAIVAVEEKNDKIAEESRRKKIKRFDKAERVSLMFKDATIKGIAERYIGEDLSVRYAKYKSEVNTILKIYREGSAGLKSNREEFYNSVKGVDEWLEEKQVKARRYNSKVIRMAEMEIKMLEKEKKPFESELSLLIKHTKAMSGHYQQKRISELNAKIAAIEERLRPARIQLDTLRANAMHIDSTEAETSVRRKYDQAMSVRAEKDNEIHQQSQFEVDMFQIAMRYENDTLDKIRATMKNIVMHERYRASEAQDKLDFMKQTAMNIDMLNAEEIENIRAKIVEKLSSEFASGKAVDNKNQE